MKSTTLILAALLVGAAAPLAAQDRQVREPRVGPPGAILERVERVLRLRQTLELTEQQVARLDALRSAEIERRQSTVRELAELQSRVRAGLAEQSELRSALQARREALQAARGPAEDPLASVLTEDQRAKLRELATVTGRPGMRGRTGAGPALRDRLRQRWFGPGISSPGRLELRATPRMRGPLQGPLLRFERRGRQD